MGTIGIEWVNKYHGRALDLKNNAANAQGFYYTLDGIRQFEYGDDLAWDQDFEEQGAGSPTAGSDLMYVDNVDIAFFSGHGSPRGPSFGVSDHDDGRAKPSEVRLGNRTNNWVVFDACQVLEDNGSVSNQWGWPVFKGLHYILGFHTICSDRGDRGRAFAIYLNAGWTVRDAWIRACEDTEGPDTWWAYLRADQAGTDTFNDHWWGKGYVSPDPTSPAIFIYLNGPC